MNRTCAICSKEISNRDICGACWKEWCNGETSELNYPIWVQELIRIQKSFERGFAAGEVPFVDMLSEDGYEDGDTFGEE